MGAMASQITSLTIVYSNVYSHADQRKHQSSASLAFVWWIHRWPVNSPHKWPVTRKIFPLDDVIMITSTSLRDQWVNTSWDVQYNFKALSKCMYLRHNETNPDSKIHAANMGPTWVLAAPGGPHVDPMNLVIREQAGKGVSSTTP